MIKNLIFLAIAGGLGTLARYGLAVWIGKLSSHAVFGGTFFVNMLGSFVAGVLLAFFENRMHLSADVRMIVFIGFMGAFTTFSAVMVDTSELVRSSAWMHAAANIVLQNGLGLAAILTGVMVGRYV